MPYEYMRLREPSNVNTNDDYLEQECTRLSLDGWRVIHISETGEHNFGKTLRSATLEREVVKQVKEKVNVNRNKTPTNS